jgi:hypothetical protein
VCIHTRTAHIYTLTHTHNTLTHTHKCMHTHIHTYIHTYIHASAHAYSRGEAYYMHTYNRNKKPRIGDTRTHTPPLLLLHMTFSQWLASLALTHQKGEALIWTVRIFSHTHTERIENYQGLFHSHAHIKSKKKYTPSKSLALTQTSSSSIFFTQRPRNGRINCVTVQIEKSSKTGHQEINPQTDTHKEKLSTNAIMYTSRN